PSPTFRLTRQPPDRSFWQLYQSHRKFLRRNRVDPAEIEPLDETQIQTDIEKDLRDQIAHNIHKGVLKQTATGDVKYSWRGMIYLWCQFLVDLVRLLLSQDQRRSLDRGVLEFGARLQARAG